MDQHKLRQKVLFLIVLTMLVFVYTDWISTQNTLTGTARWDGVTGVLLGLYVCAQPAANFLDLILFRRLVLQENTSRGSIAAWVAVNLFVLLVGWVAIFVGMTQFSKY